MKLAHVETASKTPHQPAAAATQRRGWPEVRGPNPLRAGLATAVSEQDRLSVPSFQAKLEIGRPDDPAEREADRVADEVMRMPEPVDLEEKENASDSSTTDLRRTCPGRGGELKRQPLEEKAEEGLRTGPGVRGSIPQVAPAAASTIRSLQRGGEPLSSTALSFFQPRFGRDLHRVRAGRTRV